MTGKSIVHGLDGYADAVLIAELRHRGYDIVLPEVEAQHPVAWDIGDQFDVFWEKYPRKVGKKAARKAWEKLNHDERMRAIEVIDHHTQVWWKEGRASSHLPHAATWLNGERWDDEIGFVPPRPVSAPPSNRTARANEVLDRMEQS